MPTDNPAPPGARHRPQSRTLNTVDLFCGAGGATTGLEMALGRIGRRHRGLAINHWSVAVDTMRANHPDVDTKQMGIEEAVPADLVPGRVVDLLWASPSCTHHSRAKGGKPRDNQLRAQPELILTWLDQLFVRRLIIENVPEFVEWGPLDRNCRPIKSRAGDCFRHWLEGIEIRNYRVEWRILNCADYGDATTRRRFFLQAVRKGCGRIAWPEPEYAEKPDFFLKPWRGVRGCIDWNDLGRSIFEPGRNLALNTLRRVDVGMRKFNGMSFLMDKLGAGGDDEARVHPLDNPMPVQHAGGNRCAVVRPFIVKLNNNADAEDIDKPLTSVLAGGQHHALCTPFVVRMNKGCFAESVDRPLSSQQASTVHHALCQPLIIDHFQGGEAQSVDDPIGAQTTHDRYSLVTPFIVGHMKNGKAEAIDNPIGTQTTKDKFSVCTPLILGQQGGAQALPVDKPCPTIATAGAIRLATPLIIDDADVSYLPRLPDGRNLDIRLRMLKPSELAAAHSFPADYRLMGNRSEQVRQIGNSVPIRTAAAICEAALTA